VIDRQIVWITASTVVNAQTYLLHNVADFENRSMFSMMNEANSWICDTNRTRRDFNSDHLRQWILEDSKDGLSLIDLDGWRHGTSLNFRGGIATVVISNGSEDEFQQIRLRQTGTNRSRSEYLVLNSIESAFPNFALNCLQYCESP
jgi:hypothetical protein